jgi:hypothetical protein
LEYAQVECAEVIEHFSEEIPEYANIGCEVRHSDAENEQDVMRDACFENTVIHHTQLSTFLPIQTY